MTPPSTTLERAPRAAGRSDAAHHPAAPAGRAVPAAIAALVCGVYIALAVAFSHPVVPAGSDAFGYSGATPLHGLMRFDGAWYARITAHGYAPVAGAFQPYAFLPLFPAAVAVVHAALPFIAIPPAGILVNVAATVAAVVLLASLLRDWPLRQRVLAVVALLLVPSAFFDVMFYSEGLFLLATACVLWAVRNPRHLWWAPLGVVMATLDRPVGLLLIIFVVAAVLHDSRPRWQRAVMVAASTCGAIALVVMFWRVAGSPFAFLTAEQSWSSLRTIGPANAVRWMVVQLNPSTSTNPVVLFGDVELLAAGLPLLYLIRRHGAAALYCGLAMVVAFINGNLGAQSRYLATLVPLWLIAISVIRERIPRGWMPLVAAASAAGLGTNVWLLSRFASGLWAG